ncbi:MAG: MFS transporter [Kiritimatiellae bacterium]|nr:MFS transporter [Kiritimatiellia bacterium]MDD5519793.1 MFS transporter [Kiritimatiellia bacterium]
MTTNSDITVPSNHATHVRYKVVLLAVLLAMVTYLDRACIATLAPNIMRDLQLSKEQMSWIYSAFALAYAVFEIPTAWWADRRGTRHVLTRIVVWWSAFTMATAAAFNFVSMLVTRFLFGAGEAGAWPSVARTFSRWIPKSERGTIQGIFFSGAHLAGGLTPLLVVWLTQAMHLQWRTIFVLFGLTGLVWATVWYLWFRNDPSEHRQVNAAELDKIVTGRTPDSGHHEGWDYWKRLLSHRNTLSLCLMYFPNSFAFYFCITWLPTYLKEKHSFETLQLGLFAGLPLILSVAGDLFGGITTDVVTKRFGLRVGRCAVGAIAYVLAGGAMILAGLAHQPLLAATLIALAVAASMFTLGASWSTCLDIGGNHAGVISAAMNTSGALSSVLSPLLVTWLLRLYGDWNVPLYVMGGLFLMGAVCWSLIDPRKRIFD